MDSRQGERFGRVDGHLLMRLLRLQPCGLQPLHPCRAG